MIERDKDIRTKIIVVAVGLSGLLILARLFQLQVVNGSYSRDLAGSQYSASRLYGMYNRGSIYLEDRAGRRVTVAGLGSGYTLAFNPKQISNPEDVFESLSKYLPLLEKADVIRKLGNKNDPYEELARRLDEQSADKISSLKLPGTILVKERWRYYPGESLAAQVLGFVGWNDKEFTGRYGIERSFENVLSRPPNNLYQNFFNQMLDGLHDEVLGANGSKSADIVLTIDPNVQTLAESKASTLNDEWRAKQSGILILNPKTGEILAMALSPSFNPNKYNEVSDIAVYQNSFIEDVFEMGSIMKPIVLASALDAGVINEETTYFDNGFVELNGKRIENFDGKGRGKVDMQEVLNQSLNTGAVFSALKLGAERFRNYMYKFGFEDKTNIDLPGEVSNLMANLETNKEIEMATASFGQGIALTPVSMARALGALGNGGFLIKPKIIKRIEGNLGFAKETKVTEQGRAISGKASEEITAMLVKVVDEALLHGKIKMEHYSIAAKTGTAQIASPDGGYYDNKFTHSFFGYFPAYDPKFLVFMFLREPVGVKYASETLATPFHSIAEFLLNYYDIPPDR